MSDADEILDTLLSEYLAFRLAPKITEVMSYRSDNGFGTDCHEFRDLAEIKLSDHIEKALSGDGLAFDALLDFAAELLEAKKIVPAELSAFVASFLRANLKRPPRKKPSGSAYAVRDVLIYCAVEKLVNECGFTFTAAYQRIASHNLQAGRSPNAEKNVKDIHHAVRKSVRKATGSV